MKTILFKLTLMMKVEDLRVEDLMTEKVFSVHPNDTLEKVYELMNEENVRHVPVINSEQEVKGTQLVGIITESDFIKYFVRSSSEVSSVS